MIIKRFNIEKDLKKLEEYLRNQYRENKNMTSWLPERLHDLIYRMDTQYTDAGKESKTAFIEPVSTREKYRHKGIGTAMMHGVILKCKELGIEKCYVNSYDWRRKFYNSAGFETEDSIGFWHKKIY